MPTSRTSKFREAGEKVSVSIESNLDVLRNCWASCAVVAPRPVIILDFVLPSPESPSFL